MNLTRSQRKAVDFMGNVALVACPGSGKTRTLAAKVVRCLDVVNGTPRKIACITYTNAAANEVRHRLGAMGVQDIERYCEISTIHAFCLNNVLRYFHWRLPPYRDGFTVIPPDSEPFKRLMREICAMHRLPSEARDLFELLNRDTDGSPIIVSPLTEQAALDFWASLESERLIDFTNIVYWSFYIMAESRAVTRALACKFAWFLVDEFQDTSALQVEILTKISEQNVTKFFVVGDPYQSIYAFAGARPELFDAFAVKINARRDFQLLDNWRSSQRIVEHAEKLCPRDPPMVPSGNARAFDYEPVCLHVRNSFDAIINYFLPKLDELEIDYGQSAILAPWWIKLLHLGRKLREINIPIVGPGARPYKRIHLFAPLAETICEYLGEPSASSVYAVERELFFLLSRVESQSNYRVFTFEGRKTVFRLLCVAQELREGLSDSGVGWLRAASVEMATLLIQDEFLRPSQQSLLCESAEEMVNDMIQRDVDTQNLSVKDLGMFGSYARSIKLLTMHKAKGLEFDAVAIIDLHDGRVPHFTADTAEKIEEGRRLLYVAMTRAKRVLIYVTDEENWRNQPSPFLLDNELGVYRQRIVISE